MKNLIISFYEHILYQNLVRFDNGYHTYDEIASYTMLELVICGVLLILATAMLIYWLRDLKKRAAKCDEYIDRVNARRAEEMEQELQNRLLNELEFTFYPCSEEWVSSTDAPENFFEVFYRTCPELAPQN